MGKSGVLNLRSLSQISLVVAISAGLVACGSKGGGQKGIRSLGPDFVRAFNQGPNAEPFDASELRLTRTPKIEPFDP
jgi:hypothetical protein